MNYSVKVRKIIENDSPLKAVCSVVLDDMFCVHNVKVIRTTSDRLIVAMPSETYTDKSTGNTVRKDVFYPVSQDARKALEEAVITAYDEARAVASVPDSDE
jgi:DNA-binding cell septation regulator SpoVG